MGTTAILRRGPWQNPARRAPAGGHREPELAAYADRYYRAADGLRLHYRDYAGPVSRIPVLCVPGLTRNCRDFETLAPCLAESRRVLCVDLRGRGESERDPDWRHYQPATYLTDLRTLLADAGVTRVVVVGTSLGGIMGLALAAYAPGTVAGLVLNDIGPEFGPAGIARISSYVGTAQPVAGWNEAVQQVRAVHGHALVGLADEDWNRIARRLYREGPDGRPQPDFDAAIGTALRAGVGTADASLWPLFDVVISLPVAVLRGEVSDLLLPDTVARMCARKSDLITAVIPRRGHVPLLDEPESLAAVGAVLDAVDRAA
jgi:pimeloyl-ACP methyl ester carboxylesterase